MRQVFFVFIVLAVAGLLVWYIFSDTLSEPQQHIGSFEECAAAGNAVMESYPRQCNDAAGNHFVENIGNELEMLDLIRIDAPRPGAAIASPVTLSGMARGYYFFEASFPVILIDWDGLIIAEGYATAEKEWMTTEFVPFTAILEFTKPEYDKRGTLILKRDNPSDLPENDATLEVPITFE